jgi:hypothetical protein
LSTAENAAFTDMKLHDITSGPSDPNREPLDENATADTDFFLLVTCPLNPTVDPVNLARRRSCETDLGL